MATPGDIAVRSQKTSEILDSWLHNEESIEQESESPASSSGSSTPSSVSRCECSYIPTFARGPSPPIRLLKNPNLTDCIHFVAVSYCWQSSLPPASPDPDCAQWIMHSSPTKERPIRAPRRTLGRALNYARMVDVAECRRA